jgi:hypothetical protein
MWPDESLQAMPDLPARRRQHAVAQQSGSVIAEDIFRFECLVVSLLLL